MKQVALTVPLAALVREYMDRSAEAVYGELTRTEQNSALERYAESLGIGDVFEEVNAVKGMTALG